MLSKKIQQALNKQVAAENYASQYYLSMASWCDKTGLRNSANFMYAHSESERMHMMKLLRYINDAGGHAEVGAVKEPPHDFDSLDKMFNLVFKHEKSVTQSITELVEACLQDKDYSTFNFLQWYVAEQHEEERLFQSILDLIKITGTDGRGLYFIDKEIASMISKAKQ